LITFLIFFLLFWVRWGTATARRWGPTWRGTFSSLFIEVNWWCL